jgi:flavin reductase (DIM6/NTAB) family NADH-FMN oxidoreductase RutF
MHDLDKWEMDKFPTLPGKMIAAPMIDGASLNAECRVVGTHELGHTVYIGETIWGGCCRTRFRI